MHTAKRWTIAQADPAAEELAARLKTSPLIAQALLNRGLREPLDCEAFLRPSLRHLHEPAALPGVTQAAERIARAIRDKQKIVIYGDYDVDGITATAILWHAIRALGGNVDYYIPHRIDEGYGLNAQAIGQICREGAGLIISVDCGITAIEPARAAAEHGVDLIITDHHQWREAAASKSEIRNPKSETKEERSKREIGNAESETGSLSDCGMGGSPMTPGAQNTGEPPVPLLIRESQISDLKSQTGDASALPAGSASLPTAYCLLPTAHCIVHPRLGGTTAYPNPHLCGAGVAFKLAWGIGLAMSAGSRCDQAFREFLVEATALAALGTIADVVPLVGENRVLAHYGLSGLRESKLRGIRALIASAGLTGQNLDSVHVGFLLAPRLNACGRMGHARLAVEMLTTATPERALEIATFLEQQNRERQTMERQIAAQAEQLIADHNYAADGQCAIVLGSEGWHPGVVGIVASRIVDRFHRPAILIGLTNGHGKGSGRSIAGFHLAHALDACGEYLETHGGHEMAAGLSIATPKLPEFREAFCAHASKSIAPERMVPELKIDAVAEVRQMLPALVKDLARLGPFGQGNRRPLFVCKNVTIAAPPRRVGRTGDHLQLLVRQGEQTIRCIAFNFGDLLDRLKPGTVVDLAIEPSLNEFNGAARVELEVKDLQFA